MDTKSKSKGRELVITRIFDAPRERVWEAWTDPQQIKNWWGPKGFTAPVINMDLKVGGKYLFCMRSPEGRDYWSTGVYREIVPVEKIVATDSFADKDGNVISASEYGMDPDWPLEMLTTATFKDRDHSPISNQRKTELTINHFGFPSEKDIEAARQGWNESLDKLEASL